MKIPKKPQTLEHRISYIERTIRRLGACTIPNDKLEAGELDTLKKHFAIEQVMGYSKFTAR